MPIPRVSRKHNSKSPRFSKHVSFSMDKSPETSELPYAPALFSTLTEDMCQDLWYQQDHLAAMKQEVRDLVLYGSTDEEEMSGLGRYTFERSQHKRSAIYYVIAAHRERSMDEEWVKAVSERCTGWARHIARQDGFEAYCDIYGDPLEVLLRNSSWEADLKSFNARYELPPSPGKRKAADGPRVDAIVCSAHDRHVRSRSMPSMPSTPISTWNEDM